MKSTKGLSTIVATLIIILLTLVAVGIIWVVIRNVLNTGAQTVDINSKCLAVDIQAVSVTNTSATTYVVTLKRNAGGDDTLGGIKVSVLNANGTSSGPMDFGTLNTGDQNSQTFDTTTATRGVANGTSIQFTPFFIDASGNQQLCSQSQTFSFH